MKKTITAGVALVGVVAALTACSPQSSGDPDEVRILFSAPLSGDSAESGQALLNGAELAAEIINEAGGADGRTVVIEAADDEMTTQAANSIASKFAADPKYFALAGFLDTGLAQAASVVANRSELSLVSAFGCGDSLVTDADNVFVMCAAPDANGRVAASFIADQVPGATFASISIDVPQLDFYFNGLQAVTDERHLTWASREVYPPSATDYATVVTNALASSPDAIVSGSLQASAAQVLSQIRRTNPDVLYVDMLGEGWGSTFLDTAGDAAIGAFTQDLGLGFGGDDADRNAILDRYQDEYGALMPAAAQHGYDSIIAIAAAAEAGATRENLEDKLTAIDVDGLTGPISFANGKRADERVISISEITGTTPEDRTVLAQYTVTSDGTISPFE
jgi:branched-chain amino acid transport system substrate-binding protein